jgi:hypothetical protein
MVPEPIVEDFDPEAELGCALEYYFFGGRLEFNGLPSDISGGVGVIWEPQQRTSDMDALLLEHEANIWLIPSCSISCMLGPTTWTPGRRITNLFNLEPTPLRAMTTSVEGIQGRKFDEPYRRQLRSVRLGARKTRTRSRHERSSLDTDGWPDRGWWGKADSETRWAGSACCLFGCVLAISNRCSKDSSCAHKGLVANWPHHSMQISWLWKHCLMSIYPGSELILVDIRKPYRSSACLVRYSRSLPS